MCWGGGADLKLLGPGGWKGERKKRAERGGGMGDPGGLSAGRDCKKGAGRELVLGLDMQVEGLSP